MNRRIIPWCPLVLAVLTGCGDNASSGAAEPFRVYLDSTTGKPAAEFFVGSLPGINADTEAASATSPGAQEQPDASLPEVTNYSVKNNVVVAGQRQSKLEGLLSTNSAAVAIAFDTGSGYWVLPAGQPEPANENQLKWNALCDYSPDIAPGDHYLVFAAIDANGRFGTMEEQKISVADPVTGLTSECGSAEEVPHAIISLAWDTSVDLDLQVVTPLGRLVTPKRPNTLAPAQDGTIPPEAEQIDRDSNSGCVIDGIRHENLAFKNASPQSGIWGVYVDLFDSCKQAAVHFTLSVLKRHAETDAAGNTKYCLEQIDRRPGILLASQASGASGTVGTFVVEYEF